ncbi:hypothetical protein [uncultured Croceitalea sp.]|uniref:hypothetical protein n=1 Tax=uncultured Croceitalea sp. TaxID=1798908 RepID=UPI0033057AF0
MNLRKILIVFGLPLLLILLVVLLTKSSLFSQHQHQLSIGITFDLLLTVPFVYFLLIRKTTVPKTTVIPFLILGVVICSAILPPENQYYLSLFKTWGVPLIELSILSLVSYHIVRAIKRYRSNSNGSFDFFTTLKHTCREILPRPAVIPVVTEIAVFYYGFFYWRKRKLRTNEFSYHKDSGTITLLVAIIFIVAIETVVFHNILQKWSTIVAWILTCLSIYSGIQIFGFLKSMLKRPIAIANGQLFLRYGIMTETTIDLKDIVAIEISSKAINSDMATRKLSFLGELEGHNLIIHLKKDYELIGLYGIRKTYRNLALFVDDKMTFKKHIEHLLHE